jgi:hypothetical protein
VARLGDERSRQDRAHSHCGGRSADEPRAITARTPQESVVAYVSIQSRSLAPTTIPAMVTAAKNTIVTISSVLDPPRLTDTLHIIH